MNARNDADSGLDRDDLAFVREVARATRDATRLAGSYYLLWGALVGIGLLGTWMLLRDLLPLERHAIWWLWGVLTPLGWIGTAWLVQREHRQAPVVGCAARQMGLIWASFGIVAALVYFVGAAAGTVGPAALSGLMALLVGMAIWAVGLAGSVPWFRNLAGLWWLAGAFMLYRPGAHTLPLLAAMMVLLFALPGWWLARGGRTRA